MREILLELIKQDKAEKELREEIKIAEKDFDVITSPTDYRDNERYIKELEKELKEICKNE